MVSIATLGISYSEPQSRHYYAP